MAGAAWLLLGAAVAGGWMVTRTLQATDLAVYRGAVGQWLGHGPVYGATYTAHGLLFTYPPFALLVLRVTALGPWPVVVAASVAVNVAALGVTCAVCWARPLRAAAVRGRGGWRPAVAVTVGSLALEPVWRTVGFGQVNLVLMAAVVLDATVVPRRYRGVLTGLATAVKLTPAVFVLYFAATRQLRPALLQATTAVAATVVAAVVLPGPSWTYWTSLVFQNRTGGAGYIGNQSLHGAFARLGVEQTVPWAAAAAVGVVLGYAAIRRCVRRGELMTALAVTAVTGLMVSPVSWSHHWVWVVPLVVAVHREHAARVTRAAVTVLAAATLLAPGLWWLIRQPGAALPLPLQVAGSDAYVVAGVLVLLATAGARTLQSVHDITGDIDPVATRMNPDASDLVPGTSRHRVATAMGA